MIVKPNELSMTGGSTDQRPNVDSTQSSYRRRKQSSLIKTNNKKNPPRGVVSFRRKARMVVCITVFDKKRRWSLNSCLLPQKNGTRLSSGGPKRRTTVWGGPLTSCPASVGFAFALDSLVPVGRLSLLPDSCFSTLNTPRPKQYLFQCFGTK